MKTFTFQYEKWHAWESNSQYLLSDENEKKLRTFKSTDDCINWLFLNKQLAAARAMHAHIEGIK